MQTSIEAEIHSTADLCALAACADERVCAWAIRCLSRGSHGDVSDVMRAGLSHPSPLVRRAALDGLEGAPLDADDLAALRAAPPDAQGRADEAARLWVMHGDEAATADALARLGRGDGLSDGLVDALEATVPDAMRAALRGASAHHGRADLFARVATADDLPWFFDEGAPAEARAARRAAVARLAWVDGLVGDGYSNRDWSQALDALRALDDDAWEHPDAAHLALRRVARGYLSLDPWKKALSAVRSRQWWHAIEEAGLVWARLSPGPQAPSSPRFAEAFAAVSQVRAPDQHDAHLALSLCLGAVRRALVGRIDTAACAPERLVRWTSLHGSAALQPLLDRWSASPPGGAPRADIARALTAALRSGDEPARALAAMLFSQLSDAPLEAEAALAMRPPGNLDGYASLAMFNARPALLRACAEEALRADGHALRDAMLRALATTTKRWAADLVLARLPALASDRAAYPLALRALTFGGDPRALDAIAATAPRPPPSEAVKAVHFLMALGASHAEVAPGGDGPAALRLTDEGPLAVRLRCGPCGALATHVVGAARVHPDLDACARDGWDGVVFARVVTCGACGAEDDYTLGPAQRFAIVEALAVAAEGSPVSRGVVDGPDGKPARRRGALLAQLRADADARPDDGVAWERLGDALRDAARLDDAVVAWRRSMQASPDNVSVVLGYYQALVDAGDADGADALVDVVLQRWPRGRAALDDAAAQALDLEAEFDRWLARRGAPLTLACDFAPVDGLVAPPAIALAIPLHRPRRRADAKVLLLDPRLAAVRLTRDEPDEPTALEALLEKNPFAFVTQPVPRPADERRAGRNDPCPCGSGKKYKKCHGA